MRILLSIWFVLLAASPAQAQDAGEVIYIEGSRPRTGADDLDGERETNANADRALDEPVFVTVVRVDDREGETTSTAEVLSESVGVNVRSLGGLGSFASISVRGAAPTHTAVSIDGVPLSRVAYSAIDIGSFDLATFSTIEVYRGGVPVELGGAAMGGAVNFITPVGPRADGSRLHLSTGMGSFGAQHLRGHWRDATRDGRYAMFAGVGFASAAGDYEFFDDNGTPLNPDDDGFADRTNNGFDQVSAVARGRAHLGNRLALTGGLRGAWKHQGIPGVAALQTEEATLTTGTALADAVLSGSGETPWGARSFALLERQRVEDPLGEVGLARDDSVARTVSAGATGWLRRGLGQRQVVSAAIDARVDQFRRDDRIAMAADPAMGHVAGSRQAGSLAVDDSILLAAGRVVLVPAVRVDALRTAPGDGWDPSVTNGEVVTRTELIPSPRIAGRAFFADGMAVKGSAGRYFRAPSLVELFGNAGFLVGNPGLEAEHGFSGDVGVVLAPGSARGRVDRIYVEAAGFASYPNNAIAFVPAASRVAVARNVGDAAISGTELILSARLWRALTVTGHHTFLRTRQSSDVDSFDGKALPGRPRHSLYARADLAVRPANHLVALWVDGQATSGNFLDAANLSQLPARRLVGAGVKVRVWRGGLAALEVKNLTDERVESIPLDPPPRPDLTEHPRAVADFLGYPLPGRALYLTLEWNQ